MAISNRTRKLLWGKSGNCCAICRRALSVDATPQDEDSVVGEECHIVSPRPEGPRHDPTYLSDALDDYGNLILLCRVHHKAVDDQTATYTPEILRKMKSNHEAWVLEKLSTTGDEPEPLRLRRVKENVPDVLPRLTTGKEVLDLMTSSFAYVLEHDEPESEEEVELVGGFVQEARDWGEIADDIEPAHRVSAAYSLTQAIHGLEEVGFYVFGGREIRILEGRGAKPTNWPIALLAVYRKGQ